jgi:hypothetical protein
LPCGYHLGMVNADAKSYNARRKLPAVQASINAHSQQHTWKAKTTAGYRALRNSSAARGLVGWNRRSGPPVEVVFDSRLATRYEKGTHKQEELEPGRELTIRRPITRLVPRICGKDEALDPFSCTAAKIDSSMRDLLQFFLGQIHPTTWNDTPITKPYDTPDSEAKQRMVQGCISDKARLYSLVSCTAGYMYQLNHEPRKRQQSAFYLRTALVAMRAQIQTNDFDIEESLYTILVLALCGTMLEDYDAAASHLRAAKQLVKRMGGLQSVNPFVLKTLIRADLGVANGTLSSPIFALPYSRTMPILPDCSVDPRLDQHAQKVLLQLSHGFLPTSLLNDVRQITQYARILPHVWKHSTTLSTMVGQILIPLSAVIYHILSVPFQSEIDSDRRKRFESTRVALFLWTSLCSRSIWGPRQAPPGNFSVPYFSLFSVVSLKAKKHLWPAETYELLLEWNRVIETTPPETVKQQVPQQLVQLVVDMEAYTDLKLGELMERLFELGDQIEDIASDAGQSSS